MHDLVEAYHNDGWWHGVVSGLRNPVTGLYTVSFPYSREIIQFKLAEIRPHLAYVGLRWGGKWVPVLGKAQQNLVCVATILKWPPARTQKKNNLRSASQK